MRKIFIAGNWKMNGSLEQTNDLLTAIIHNLPKEELSIDCVVCPPSPYWDKASLIIRESNSPVELGAQDITPEVKPAFTGEISPAMLHEFGCKYAIIGHSERRGMLQESNELVATKVDVALSAKLHPILCVGETEEEHNLGLGLDVVAKQLRVVLDSVCISEMQAAVIAYEPVWAIGTGKTATPEHMQTMHKHIRSIVAEYDATISSEIRIIYGGSVNSKNATEILQQPDVDGCLIGGASLKAQDFSEICHIAMGL